MKSFSLKALFFILVLSLILNQLGTLADHVAPLEDWRVEYEDVEENLQARNESIKAVTLGNSHAGAIDYSVLEFEGQSMAFAAADLFEIEKIVQTLDHKLPQLNMAFVTISPYSFSRDNAKFKALQLRRISFYSIFPVWSPIQDDWYNFLKGKVDTYTRVMSVVRSDNWEGVWPNLLTNDTPKEIFPYDGVHTLTIWGECSHYTAEQLDTHAQEIAWRNVSSSIQMSSAHSGLQEDAFMALARTIEHLQSRDVQVILYTPTYYDKYNLYFADGGAPITEHMKQAISRLQQIYEVEYYDFSDDLELSTQPELFYNSDHLNDCGAKAMSKKLLESLGGKSKFTE